MAKATKAEELNELVNWLDAIGCSGHSYSDTFLAATAKFIEVIECEMVYQQPINNLEKREQIAALIEKNRILEEGDRHDGNCVTVRDPGKGWKCDCHLQAGEDWP